MLGMMSTIEEMSYCRRHVQTPLLLFLLRFQQAQLYLSIVVARHLKVALHLLFLQKGCSASLDWQGGNCYDELVESATLVQFKHSSGIDVCLSGTRLHLDVKKTMVRQILDLVRKHIMSHPLLGGFIQYVAILTHKA